jgi:hypothetical protein
MKPRGDRRADTPSTDHADCLEHDSGFRKL